MKRFGFVREYSYQWPGEAHPRRYSQRYDGVDRAMTRPIHREMSVAPPDASAGWLCQRCGEVPHTVLGGRWACLRHWWKVMRDELDSL